MPIVPDSIRELIMKNLVAALEAIQVPNGYSTSLNAVERTLQQGQASDPPMAYVIEGDDEVTAESPLGYLTRNFEVGIVLVVAQDLSEDARSASEAMNAVIADVQKKVQEDERRGGLALMTEEMAVSAIEIEEGMPTLRATVGYRVKYRHARLDPYTAG